MHYPAESLTEVCHVMTLSPSWQTSTGRRIYTPYMLQGLRRLQVCIIRSDLQSCISHACEPSQQRRYLWQRPYLEHRPCQHQDLRRCFWETDMLGQRWIWLRKCLKEMSLCSFYRCIYQCISLLAALICSPSIPCRHIAASSCQDEIPWLCKEWHHPLKAILCLICNHILCSILGE